MRRLGGSVRRGTPSRLRDRRSPGGLKLSTTARMASARVQSIFTGVSPNITRSPGRRRHRPTPTPFTVVPFLEPRSHDVLLDCLRSGEPERARRCSRGVSKLHPPAARGAPKAEISDQTQRIDQRRVEHLIQPMSKRLLAQQPSGVGGIQDASDLPSRCSRAEHAPSLSRTQSPVQASRSALPGSPPTYRSLARRTSAA
jgi:hypothetical protein